VAYQVHYLSSPQTYVATVVNGLPSLVGVHSITGVFFLIAYHSPFPAWVLTEVILEM